VKDKMPGARRWPVRIIVAVLALFALIGTTASACDDDDADVASENISKDADNFKVPRRIIFLNSITDKNLLVIEGKCAIEDEGNQLEVTCKRGEGDFVKHFLGLSPNVTYFVEQLQGVNVSVDHYKVTFNPSAAVPDVDWR
jgi:hypothetical protein